MDIAGAPKLKTIIAWTAWPGLFALCLLITGYGFVLDKPVLFFNLSYFILAVSLYTLEQIMPHERDWNRNDG